MSTDIHNLPNEMSKNNSVVMNVNEPNKSYVQNNVAAQVKKEIQHQYKQQQPQQLQQPQQIQQPQQPQQPQHRQQQQGQTQLSPDSIHQIVQGLQQAGGGTALPSRDIHTNTGHIVRDEEIKPNFIPSTTNENYIENEEDMESLIQQNKNNKKEQDRLDILYNELQTPLLIMILFFFFQLPYFNKVLVKYMPSLFSRDGNPTFSGFFIKTLFFGVSFYAITRLTKQLSEI
tara:strand:- start:849 stop:1538 length:690 start_codon:yes stop_codon:yes gene_type:complete